MNLTPFPFTGHWQFTLHLPTLATLRSERFFGSSRMQEKMQSLQQGIIPVRIIDIHNDDPDPLPEQLQTISWLQQNEQTVLDAAFIAVRDTVYSHYKNMLDDEADWFPPLHTVNDLYNVVGIHDIAISTWHKNGMAYYTLSFDFSGDEEHGLCLVMHDNRVIDFGGIGDTDERKTAADAGIDYREYLDAEQKRQEEQETKIHIPHPKYGKLKPWQEDANHYYPFGLLHEDRAEELRAYIAANPPILTTDGSRLLSVAILHQKNGIVDFLLDMKPPGLYQALNQAAQQYNGTLMERIINTGVDVNEKNGRFSVLYDVLSNIRSKANDPEKVAACKTILVLLFEKGIDPFLKDRFGNDAYDAVKRIEPESLQEEIVQLMEHLIRKR